LRNAGGNADSRADREPHSIADCVSYAGAGLLGTAADGRGKADREPHSIADCIPDGTADREPDSITDAVADTRAHEGTCEDHSWEQRCCFLLGLLRLQLEWGDELHGMDRGVLPRSSSTRWHKRFLPYADAGLYAYVYVRELRPAVLEVGSDNRFAVHRYAVHLPERRGAADKDHCRE